MSVDEQGSASIIVLGIVLGAVFLVALLGVVGGAYVAHAELQQAADLAASALEQMAGDDPRARAESLARANGARRVEVTELDGGTKLRIEVSGPAPSGFGIGRGATIHAESIAIVPRFGDAGSDSRGEYDGPLELVDGIPVCPRVAAAYRAMDAAAARDGITLTATSGFRSYAEQAALYAQLGPAIAAPPGVSRHHDATELDIAVGPAGSSLHRWLQANGPALGFIQRYSWEPWHWGFVAGC